MLRSLLGCLIGVLALLAAAGCDVIVTSDGDRKLPDAATEVDGTQVWDLRERPTALEVGIAIDDTAVFETRPSRPVLVRLPGGAELRLPVRYVAFSAIGSTSDAPVSVDLKTETMPLDDVVKTYRSVLEQLELPAYQVVEFRRAAIDATGTARVRQDRVAGQFGDLELGVVARYNPNSETGLVALGGGWLDE